MEGSVLWLNLGSTAGRFWRDHCDQATLSVTNAAAATGKVTYSVYSTAACTELASKGAAETITNPGELPASSPYRLILPGPTTGGRRTGERQQPAVGELVAPNGASIKPRFVSGPGFERRGFGRPNGTAFKPFGYPVAHSAAR